MTDDHPRAIPFDLIEAAVADAGPDDAYVVVRSDRDYRYATTIDEATAIEAEMRSEIETLSPVPHTVQVVAIDDMDAEGGPQA